MKRLSDYKRGIETEDDLVRRLLHAWHPGPRDRPIPTQLAALRDWLARHLPEVPIGDAPTAGGLTLQDEHLIELVAGFTKAMVAEFSQCLDQLRFYRENWIDRDNRRVWLVVLGPSTGEFSRLLGERIAELNSHFVLAAPYELIEKR